MAEQSPVAVLDQAAKAAHVAEIAPISPAGPNGIEAGSVEYFQTPEQQGEALHTLIYDPDALNGVPDAETRDWAKEFMSHVTRDDGGVYRDAQGNALSTGMVEDIAAAANPESWVRSHSQTQVLGRARQILHTHTQHDIDHNAQNFPVLDAARTVAGMHQEKAGEIDSDTLDRLIGLNADASAELLKQKGGEAKLERLRSERDAALNAAMPAPVVAGRAHMDADLPVRYGDTPSAPEAPDTQQTAPLDTHVPVGDRRYSGRAPVVALDGEGGWHRVEYATIGSNVSDADILSHFIESGNLSMKKGDLSTLEAVARTLYPNRMIGGTGTYGRSLEGTQYNERNSAEQALTPEELRRARDFASKLDVIRGREAAIPAEFEEGVRMPTHQELAEELFPGVDRLTREDWQVVRAGMSRLRAVRAEQVRRDHLVGPQMAAGRAGQHLASARKRAAALRDRARQTVTQTREALQQESLRDRVRRRLGAAAVRGLVAVARTVGTVEGTAIRMRNNVRTAVRENLNAPALRERAGRVVGAAVVGAQAVGERLRNIEWGDLPLKIAARLQETAENAVQRAQAYARARAEALRSTERGEIIYRVIAVSGTVAVAGVLAARAYMQYKHSMELPGMAGGHRLPDNLTDHLPSGTGDHHSAADTLNNTGSGSGSGNGNNALPAPTAPASGHDIVEIGKYNGHVKIHGYPQGSAGYRILESAKEHGLDVSSSSKADRLIDATLKQDHMSWNAGVSADQKITLLTPEQMQAILNS